jgi:hypothetical protein
MPPANTAPLKLVPISAACDSLGITRRTFWRHWATAFTDSRHPNERGRGHVFKVFSDELELAVREGGGRAARVAVLNYRGLAGRA